MMNNLFTQVIRLIRAQGLGLLALVIVLSGGAAYAAGVAHNSVGSKQIRNGQVKTVDLANDGVNGQKVADASLTGGDVADNALTGDDVDESTLGVVPNASQLGGLPPSSYLRGTVYKTEATTDAGSANADGTSSKSFACRAGDILLSGGPASLNATTDLIESFPTPGSTNSWFARVNKNGVADSWTVVILCLDVP